MYPSGEYGNWNPPFLIGDTSSKGPLSVAMLVCFQGLSSPNVTIRLDVWSVLISSLKSSKRFCEVSVLNKKGYIHSSFMANQPTPPGHVPPSEIRV